LFLLAAIMFAGALHAPIHAVPPVGTNELKEVRWDAKASSTRLVVEFSQPPDYRSTDDQESNGYFYLDFLGMKTDGMADANYRLDDERLFWLRRRIFPDQRIVRLIVDTNGPHPLVIQKLDNPPRLVVDVFEPGTVPENAKAARVDADATAAVSFDETPFASESLGYLAKPARVGTGPTLRKPFTVIIDPGHGGSSLGAASLSSFQGRKTLEKDIALAISLEVRKALAGIPNIKVIMTRETDKSVGLEERVDFSESKQPDLFVSIHLNAAPGGGARGIEFFYLSERGRSQLEGRIGRSLSSRQKSSPGKKAQQVVQRMARDKTKSLVAKSAAFAATVEAEFRKIDYYRNRNRGLKTANFYVLKNAVCPAILVEVGFMTSTEDITRLRQSKYQKEAAQRIAEAIKRAAQQR